MKIIQCQQGTPEWWLARQGIPTASNFSKIITPKTGKLSSQATDYACELIADAYRLNPPDGTDAMTTRAMQYGIDTEPEARRWYEMERSVIVQQVGFCKTDDERFGCSPDGLIGEEGGLELKCPYGRTQVSYLLEGILPSDYKAQVHGSMIVTGRPWWDFLSYCPGLPPLLIRVVPDDFTKALANTLEQFWVMLQEYKANIKEIEG